MAISYQKPFLRAGFKLHDVQNQIIIKFGLAKQQNMHYKA